MDIGSHLRSKRLSAELAGATVCLKAGIQRSRLSDIERNYVKPTVDEVSRISTAVDELARAKSRIAAVAADEGWPSWRG